MLKLVVLAGGNHVEKPFPAYEGTASYTFVCYGHEDAALVYPELERLHQSGCNLWYDEGIAPGHEWTQDLAQAIDRSSRVLFFVSRRSVASMHCRREIHYALEQQKFVVCVHLEPTDLPAGMKLSLGLAQAILKHEMDDPAYRRKLALALQWNDPLTRNDEQKARVPRLSGRAILGVSLMFAVLLGIAGTWWWQQRPASPERSASVSVNGSMKTAIAILPFANLSDDPEQQFFSDGIAEDLINGLARSTELIVRPRSSSFQFRESGQDIQSIGRRLEVSHILEGSVRTSGDHVRVSAQLIDIASNRPIWSQRFDRELVGIFEVQDAITRDILKALDAQLVQPDPSRSFASSEAYEAFLRGRHQFNRYEFADAERWLAKAVELDPRNAAAWALLADVKSYQSAYEFAPNAGEQRESRRVFLQRALDIDPGNARALAQRAFMDIHIENLAFQAAIDELARLATLHPNDEQILINLGFVMNAIGHANAADRVFRQVLKLAPLSMDAHIQRIGSLLLFNRVDVARQEFRVFSGLGFYFPPLSAQLAMVNRDSQALRAVIHAGGLGPWDTSMYEAIAVYLDGDFEEARRLAESLEQVSGYVSHRRRANIALIKRDFDAAFVAFVDAVHAHEQLGVALIQGSAGWRAVFPEFFEDKRFVQMLAELGMDPASTAKITVPNLPF